jgi:hypothetical protein
VMRDPTVTFARVGGGDASGEHGSTTERERRMRDLGERRRAVAEAPARPGPTEQTATSRPAAQSSAGATERQRTSPPKHGATATLASVRPRARNARSASESETASASPCTWM